jgi:hypothetical protein
MPLYEPLREGFRELNKMMMDSQVFNARRESAKEAAGLKAEMQEATLQQMLANEKRKAQGREIVQSRIAELSVDPVQNMRSQLSVSQAELEALRGKRRHKSFNMLQPNERLSITSGISMLEKETKDLDTQLKKPAALARLYRSKATEAGNLALEAGMFDPNSANILQGLANRMLKQADSLLEEEKLRIEQQKARKTGDGTKGQPVLKFAEVPGKPGSGRWVPVPKGQLSKSPVEVDPRLKNHVWSEETKGADKDLVLETVDFITEDILGKRSTLEPTLATQTTAVSFATTILSKLVKEKRPPKDEAEVTQFGKLAVRTARDMHNKRLATKAKKMRDLHKQMDEGTMSDEEFDAEIEAMREYDLNKFGQVLTVRWETLVGKRFEDE